LAADRLLIQCDTAKMRMAISNIIKNAIIFSNPGQTVQISLRKLPGHVRIEIADSGIGIATEDLHRIFQRFYQVEDHLTRRHGGMGLGLAVSKEIIESHGGQIWVESTLGVGSTFTILLPTRNSALS
jgi:two-component system sensor histidine kinase VicK